MPALAQVLSSNYDFQTTVLIDSQLEGEQKTSIEGLDTLGSADLVILYLRFRQLPEAQLAKIQAYIESGRPIVAFRTTTHAFAYEGQDPRAKQWNNFGARELGAPWIYHYGHDTSTDAKTVGQHPILNGVSTEFHVRSWTYHVRPDYPPKSANILVYGCPVFADGSRGDEETFNPIAWTHTHSSGGRVFTTTMGHPADFDNPNFRQLVINGIHWALGRESPAQLLPDWEPIEMELEDEWLPDEGPWLDMNYGPFLSTSISVEDNNTVHKGIVIPLTEDINDGAVVFDTDLLRYGAGWINGFIDFEGVVYNGIHGTFPSIVGDVMWSNPMKPGCGSDRHLEDPRDRLFGPLPKDWAQWRGLYLYHGRVILSYTIGDRKILEMPGLEQDGNWLAFTRTFHLGPSESDHVIRLITRPNRNVQPSRKQYLHLEIESETEKEGILAEFAGIPPANVSLKFSNQEKEILLYIGPSDQPIVAKILIVPFDGETNLETWQAFRQSSPMPEPLNRFTNGGTASWSDKLVTRGVLDTQRLITVETIEVSDQSEELADWSAERSGYRAAIAATDLRSWSDKANVAGHIAVLNPPDTSLVINEEIEDDKLIGWWQFDEGIGNLPANRISDKLVIELDGATWRRGYHGRCVEFDGNDQAFIHDDNQLDFDSTDLTIAVWVSTNGAGTILSETLQGEEWVPNGKTLFIRNGHLAFDVGWIGVVESEVRVNDGRWHHIVLTWQHQLGEAAIFIDGERAGNQRLKPDQPLDGDVLKLGFTADNFPEEMPWFSGKMDGLRIYDRALTAQETTTLFERIQRPLVVAFAVIETESEYPMAGAAWSVENEKVSLHLEKGVQVKILKWTGVSEELHEFARYVQHGGLEVNQPFAIDRIDAPNQNPWSSWLRFGGFDFFSDGSGAAISTWSGDVWTVSGLDEDLDHLVWQRVATGLNQPLGLKIVDDQIYVVGRDQITRLVDLNGDGETDFYQNFNNDTYNTEHFHEPCMDLQIDATGNFYYMKAARHALRATHPHHGTLIRVSPNGHTSEVVAYGFRASNGLGIEPGPVLYGTDQEGHWMPANRLNRIKPGEFHGNVWGWTPDNTLEKYVPPLCWLHPEVDRSPAEPLWIPSGFWGTLEDSLLHLSYGNGKIFSVLQQQVGDTFQAAVTELGIRIPTGTMRGRFNSKDGHLYVCGLVGWSSDQLQEGGFYRVRQTGAPIRAPRAFQVVEDGMVLTFATPLDADSATDPDNWRLQAWNYRWSEEYGSPAYTRSGEEGRDKLTIQQVMLSKEGKAVFLQIPDIMPTMQFHLIIRGFFSDGTSLENYLHGTIHVVENIPGQQLLDAR